MVENFLINNKNYLFICTLLQTRYFDRIYIRIYKSNIVEWDVKPQVNKELFMQHVIYGDQKVWVLF